MSTPKQIAQFLTVNDIAAMLHRAPKTVNDWVKLERIPHIKLQTGGVLFDPVAIDKWIREGQVSAIPRKDNRRKRPDAEAA